MDLLCQHFDCFFLGGNKKHTLALIALIDKIFERFAGITRVIAINCNASTIVGVLLQIANHGIDKQTVSELAGHGDTSFLERTYCHPQMALKQQAAQVMTADICGTLAKGESA